MTADALSGHVDALLTIAFGAAACCCAYRRPKVPAAPRRRLPLRLLRILGPLVILFGIALLALEPSWQPSWKRFPTADGAASAEFPGPPAAEEMVDAAGGTGAKRVSLTFRVPCRDISLNLSASAIPPGSDGDAGAEMVRAIKDHFAANGFRAVLDSVVRPGKSPTFSLESPSDDGRTHLWTRLCFSGTEVYRVVAACDASSRDDPIITRFLDSFRIEEGGAAGTAPR